MTKGESAIVMGVFILALALILWRTTGSFPGWLALFLPGAALVGRGLWALVRSS